MLFACFEQSAWEDYSVQEKTALLQSLADFEAEKLGTRKIPIIVERIDIVTLGGYNDETESIRFNLQHLSDMSAEQWLNIVSHEMYHSYQDYLVKNMDWESEISQSAYFEEIRSWKDNLANYVTSVDEGFDAYKSQPLEVSARAYAEEEVKQILKYIE